ncbi:MAG: hypothetical protein NW215_06440 [Hyphomicrobiales bacterium]|nr:hypothetical protein [Hyphomicrobiales bacterium]
MTCTAKTGAAKILKSPKQSDVHPLWPTAKIGEHSFTLTGGAEEKGDGAAAYVSGALISSQDGVLPGKAYIVAAEWDCFD